MKLNSSILFLFMAFNFLIFLHAEDCSPGKTLPRPQADEWTVGAIVPIEKNVHPQLTQDYEEMLKNSDKKLISLGLNNSGIVNLKETVVISDNPKYLYNDGITGKISASNFLKKPILTDSYTEMLSDKKKRLISLQVNKTAFYDPDNQVLVKGTGEMPIINPLNYHMAAPSKMETPFITQTNTLGKLKFLSKEEKK